MRTKMKNKQSLKDKIKKVSAILVASIIVMTNGSLVYAKDFISNTNVPIATSTDAPESTDNPSDDVKDASDKEIEISVFEPGLHVTSGLTIDGYYDDWVGYPVTEITYKSNNKECNHMGQIYVDGDTVYAHFSMNEIYGNQVMPQDMKLIINGVNIQIGLEAVKPDNSFDYSYPAYNLPNGIHTNFGVIVTHNGKHYCESEGAITIYDSTHRPDTRGDAYEFSFSLKDLSRIVGKDFTEVSSIQIKNPNIGNEGPTWVGSSTGPFILALLGFAIAGGTIIYKKKSRTKNV